MSIVYSGAHSITFYAAQDSLTSSTPTVYSTRIRTWTDLHLVPAKRPSIATPSPSIKMIQIPGSSKRIDFTDLSPGGLKFGTRRGKWDFIVDNERWIDWVTAKSTIESVLNGKRLYCVLEDESSIAYRGRFTVQDWKTGKEYSTISIGYELEYKLYDNAFVNTGNDSNINYISDWIELDNSIKNGTYSTKYKKGDCIYLEIANEYNGYAEIVGIDLEYDDSSHLIPVTFLLKNQLNNDYRMNLTETNAGAWANSLMRTTYMQEFKKAMPGRLQAMLRKTRKYTYFYNYSSLQITYDELWIPSYREINANPMSYYSHTYETEGPIYFTDRSILSRTKLVSKNNGSWEDVWLRTAPWEGEFSYLVGINADTYHTSANDADSLNGVVLGFGVGASS